MIRRLVCVTSSVALMGAALTIGAAPASATGPGSHTQAEINTSVHKGLAYLGTQQNADVSFVFFAQEAHTGFALMAYAAASHSTLTNLSVADRSRVQKAVNYLLSVQSSAGTNNGAWGTVTGYVTYSTGVDLAGLGGFVGQVSGNVAGAISRGRAFLVSAQQITEIGRAHV